MFCNNNFTFFLRYGIGLSLIFYDIWQEKNESAWVRFYIFIFFFFFENQDFTYSHFKKERYHKNSEVSILTFVRLKTKKKRKKVKLLRTTSEGEEELTCYEIHYFSKTRGSKFAWKSQMDNVS